MNGQKLAVWERAGLGAPTLFVHATGFHARCWDQVIARVPPARRLYTVDMRGHGLSSKPDPPYSWRRFGEDVAALSLALNLRGAIGVGHSMGGHSLVLAASLAPDAFSRLLLLDPVIMPEEYYTGAARVPHFARKRRNRWSSTEEMFENFSTRPPFKDWEPAVLRDYCEHGLVDDGDDFVLACPPEVEGSIYENSSHPDASLYGVMRQLTAEVTVVRSNKSRMGLEGPKDMTSSPTAPDLASRFRRGRDVVVNFSHFIPMESPGVVAGWLGEAVA